MRKVKILSAVLFAALTFGVVAAESASAAQWLVGFKVINMALPATTTGKILFLVLKALGGTIHIVCSGKLLGKVGPTSEDLIEKVEGLTLPAEELWLDCEVLHAQLGACSGSLLVLIMAEHLSWKTLLLEPNMNEFIDDFKEDGKGDPAFELECTGSGGQKFAELCLAKEISTDALKNVLGGGVEGKILNWLSDKCGVAGIEAHIEAEGTTTSPEGALSVSK